MLLFASLKSPWGQSVASAEGGNGVHQAVGVEMGHSLSEGLSMAAVSLQVSAAGGLWRRRQCMKQAASSLAGHIRQSDAVRGREGSWWSTLGRGRPRQLQLGEEQTRKPWQGSSSQLPVCTLVPPRTQMGNWGKSGKAVEQCLLGVDSFCLHFTSC